MLVLTGVKERTTAEYSAILDGAGFRLNRVIPTPSAFVLIESLPM